MNRIVGLSLFMAALLGAAGFALSSEERLSEGITYFEKAKSDPEGNMEKAREILESLQDENPIAKAYYGCLCTIEAGVYANKNKLLKAMSLLKRGAALMDDAVNAASDNAEIRFLRLTNSYDLSESTPLNRDKVMKEDLAWLEAREDRFDPSDQGVLQLYKGLYQLRMRKKDAARAAFQACISVSPLSEAAAEAERRLAELDKRK
jgi:tetratricopeptide (TPR) repeat protein